MGVRYSYLIPHIVPYRGLAIPYRTVSPYFFFFNTVSSRYGTVRYWYRVPSVSDLESYLDPLESAPEQILKHYKNN
jgi:hypothetical protein